MRRYAVAAMLGALLLTSGCGGGDRPSVDEVSKALRQSGEDSLLGPSAKNISKRSADCIAKVLVDSDVSDQTLRKIVAAQSSYQPSKADETALGKVAPKMIRCIPQK